MKCDKFEELFIQETDEKLLNHIQSCETCMLEYKKMQKTESLIKEVKLDYKTKTRNANIVKIAASFVLASVCCTIALNSFYVPKLTYEEHISSFVPVDEYGLVDIR